MWKNYLKTAIRHLWSHRLFTLLNVIGLAIGISACWVIYKLVDYEYSYESELPKLENTYRLITHINFENEETRYGGVSAPIYQAIRDEVPGVDLVVPVYSQWVGKVDVPQPHGDPLHFEGLNGIVAVQREYFHMVPYTWLVGNDSLAFRNPESVVLTESRARLYFPGLSLHEMLGREIVYLDDRRKTVGGIVEDQAENTEFNASEFFYLRPTAYPLNEWTNTNGGDRLYLQLHKDASLDQVLAQINEISKDRWDQFNQERDQPLSVNKSYEFLPLTESHFSTEIRDSGMRKASKSVLYGLIGVGVFLLLLAGVNYINLSTAQLPQRSKEIGVRKTLGGGAMQLMGQMLTETFLTVLLAILVALVLSKITFILLEDMMPAGLQEYVTGYPLVFLIALILLVTGLSGVYPSWLMSRMRPMGIIRGVMLQPFQNKRPILRKSLIVFQFFIAQLFIVGALIIGRQLTYVLQKDMGFDKEAVVLVPIPWTIQRDSLLKSRVVTYVEELQRLEGVKTVSLGIEPLSTNYSSSPFQYKKEDGSAVVEHSLFIKWVDTTYIDFYNMELIAGRNIRSTRPESEFVINETAARIFGFADPQDALGKTIGRREQEHFPIVGVVRDFHNQDFYSTIDPIVLMYNPSSFGTVNIKLKAGSSENWQEALAAAEKLWYDRYPPDTFSSRFYDEMLESLYEQERNLSKVIQIATVISIVISCLGLFGLTTLTAFQRTKEIGIRKVLGANVAGIVGMLSKEFVVLIVVAMVLAAPVAWYAMDKWLQDFAYKVEISWWVFPMAGMGALMVALLTVSSQALKAALSNPVKSLKSE